MGGKDDGAPLAGEIAHHRPEGAPTLDVHGGRRLVQKDEVGIPCHCQGEAHPLGLPAGEPLCLAIDEAREPGAGQCAPDGCRVAVETSGHRHELADLDAVGEPAASAHLEHGTDLARCHGGAGVGAEDRDVALLGALQAEENGDRRRLAGAVRTEKSDRLAPRDIEVEMVQRHE
jgi:hypothetical protein